MNRSRHLIIGLGIGLSFAVAACGLDPNAPVDPFEDLTTLGSGPDSGNTNTSNAVEACQALEDTLAACQPALAGALQCQAFDNWPCDIAAYFQCVEDAYGECSNGTFPDLDATAYQNCTSLTTC